MRKQIILSKGNNKRITQFYICSIGTRFIGEDIFKSETFKT